jgi:acyl carrier protein
MTAADVKRVRALVSEMFDVAESKITNDVSFEKDFGVDSLDVYELILEVEKEFNLSISDEDVETLTTFGSLINYICKHTGKDDSG